MSKKKKLSYSSGMKHKFSLLDYIIYFCLAIAAFITLYPVWYVFCVSLSSPLAINSGAITFWPIDINIDAYLQILETPRIPRAYLNSIIYTSLATFLCVLSTVLFAYPLSRKEFIFRKPLTIMVTITMFFHGGLIPNFILLQGLGLMDSMWALILPSLIVPFDFIVVKSFFEGIPSEMHEAAVVDGASEFRILWQIYIPLAKPAIASIALFFAMGQWNSYLTPMIYLNTSKKLPLQVILREMLIDMTGQDSNTGMEQVNTTPASLKNATVFVSILPFILAYPFVQRYFVKGLTIGAVKG